MAPKKNDGAKKGEDKAKEKAREKVAQDKTFGLKNKNKSKVVQKFVKQMQASAGAHSGRPKNAYDEKKKKEEGVQQKALLASLFNMATDKKGKVFDPVAKKKAKEKSMEDEKCGANLKEEVIEDLVTAVKVAIRLVSANKGAQCSVLGGSQYIKEAWEKHKDTCAGVQLGAFVKHQKNQFWIAEEDVELQNPVVRVLEDVEAQEAEDCRMVYLQLDERRYELSSDTSLPRVVMRDLKAWWEKSVTLQHNRDPDTGLPLETDMSKMKIVKVKMTGEEMFKKDPNLYKKAGEDDGIDLTQSPDDTQAASSSSAAAASAQDKEGILADSLANEVQVNEDVFGAAEDLPDNLDELLSDDEEEDND